MGPGTPYAFGAKMAHPDRPVVAFVGDGAMQMNGINELITIAKYWREWADPRLVVLVLHNNDLNQVTWEQRAIAGDPSLRAEFLEHLEPWIYRRYLNRADISGIKALKRKIERRTASSSTPISTVPMTISIGSGLPLVLTSDSVSLGRDSSAAITFIND